MKLIGSYRSPFVRRVAITLNVQGMPFEHLDVPVFDNPDDVNKYNPLTRVPTLVLDDGEVLIESYAMIDALDDMVGPDKALIPVSGKERRHVMRVTAAAVGTMDKAQWAAYLARSGETERALATYRELVGNVDGKPAAALSRLLVPFFDLLTDGGVAQNEVLEPRQGALSQGGGEGRGACVAHMHTDDNEAGHGRQCARAQPRRQLLHTVGAGCWLAEVQPLERWQHRSQRAQ